MSKRLLYLTMLISMVAALSFAGPAAAEGETPVDPTLTPEVIATEVVPTEAAPTEAAPTEAAPTVEPTPTETATPEPITLEILSTDEVVAAETAMLADAAPAAATLPPIFYVKKQAFGTIASTWRWTIDKIADTTALILSSGQQHSVTYTVTVSAVEDVSWTTFGTIIVRNQLTEPVEVISVTDLLDNGTLVPLSCDTTFPVTLQPPDPVDPSSDPGGRIVCHFDIAGTGTPPVTNTAAATLADGSIVTGTAAIDYSDPVVTDECVEVVDSFGGTLGTVCAGDGTTSFSFTYSWTVGPYLSCGRYVVDNTAVFTTSDTSTAGSDSWSVAVDVPCLVGCTLTPGYWKTHSSFGPAPYDDTWAQVGEGTSFFSSGQTWYQVLWTSPSGGNAYYILAHAYIAAVLNGLNGADTSAVTAQLSHAAVLFGTYSPTSTLSRAVRADFISTASLLDQYNNGLIGPAHCSQ